MSIRGTMTVRASPVGGDNLQGVKICLSDGPRCASPDMRLGLAGEFQFRARGVHERVRRIHRAHDFVDADGPWRERCSHGGPFSVASISRFVSSADGAFSFALPPAFFVSAGRAASTSAAAP